MRILLLLLIFISFNLKAEIKEPNYSFTFEILDSFKNDLPIGYYKAIKDEIINLYQPFADEDGITGIFSLLDLELKNINEDNIIDIVIKYHFPGNRMSVYYVYIVRKPSPPFSFELINVDTTSFYPEFIDTRTYSFLDYKTEMYFEEYICKFNPNKINYKCYQITNIREDSDLNKCKNTELNITYYDTLC